MHNLSGQKSCLIFFLTFTLFLGSINISKAQWINLNKRKSIYKEDVSSRMYNPSRLDKKLHFGFFLAYTSSKFSPKLTDAYLSGGNNLFTTINGVASPGFALGFYANYKIADFWDIRLHAQTAFYETNLEYSIQNGETTTQAVEMPMFELPILLKYRSQIRGTRGMYMIFGIKPALALSAGKEDDTILQTTGSNLSIEYGFGFDIFAKYFKFAPELRFSHGLVNVHKKDPDNPASVPLESLNQNTVTLYFHFGG